jgi:predicted HD superfamily hydrolase involved in NAD metabolism
MSTIYIDDKCRIDDYLKTNLKDTRYMHSLAVEKMAVTLAHKHGADVDKAAIAGRYHDIAKCFSQETMDRLIREYGLDWFYLGNQALAHSKVGVAILQNEFNIQDKDILNAVSFHTTGRDQMSLLEEVIYVADAIDDTRDYSDLKMLQKLALDDLDAACLYIMNYTVDRLQRIGKSIDNDTIAARDFIISKIID